MIAPRPGQCLKNLLLSFKRQARVDLNAVDEAEGAVGDEHERLLVGVDPEHERHLRTVAALHDRRLGPVSGLVVLIWK